MDGLAPTVSLFLVALLAFFLRRFFSAPSSSSKSKNSTTISFSEIVKNGHRFVEWTAELILASPTNTIVLPTSVITGNPKNVEHVLKTNFHNYPKGHNQTSVLADLLGGGIFNTDGDSWRLQRKTASLEFNTKTIRSFILGNVHLEVADRLIPRLARAAADDEVVDLQDLLDRLAFDNVCKVAFDVDPARLAGDDSCNDFFRAFESATAICITRFRQPRLLWRLCRALNLRSERQLKRDVSVIDDFAMRVVRERKARTAEEIRNSSDLLSRFIAEDDGFSDEFLRDIVTSFVLAGRDTTSSAMAWLFWLVSTRPAVEQRILAEICAVRSRHGNQQGMLTLEELREMDYLHATVSEALRLYPPVVLQPRQAEADDVLPDGTAVRAGMSVTYNTYAMGRMEGIWGAEWGEFKPERWLDKDGAFRPVGPFRFPVFHAGPRTCLGKEMAYTQMKAVAASVMERFEMEVVDKGREREVEFFMLLRMKGGLVVRVREREPQRESLGSTHVRRLRNAPWLGLFGSAPRIPPSQGLSTNPARRPRRGGGAQCGPSNDQVNVRSEMVLRVQCRQRDRESQPLEPFSMVTFVPMGQGTTVPREVERSVGPARECDFTSIEDRAPEDDPEVLASGFWEWPSPDPAKEAEELEEEVITT
ncbi:hypothetical protein BHE74_00005508 [Ensete ventricosum]|nr:hypothetical protein BHE74_00005508 [Ensete ventricosum]